MSLFDAYFFVDWSASNKPTRLTPNKDSIWLGELVRGSLSRITSALVSDLKLGADPGRDLANFWQGGPPAVLCHN
jgi:hypothetical protein